MLKKCSVFMEPLQWRKLSLLVIVFYLFNLFHCDLLFYMLVFFILTYRFYDFILTYRFYRFPRIKMKCIQFLYVTYQQ